ncbi:MULTISPECIES: bifunctional oligoribonuclease/PAP phosphatase NrnA [unclassified Paenibacillus]|uniref:DHH family phosphoesterase n=1 Tax=unclassified Paenibacillus TaxID=185978 RepID=UPI001AE4D46A|nr:MULTISPECIES: bifunctional oligoribonuclease/PAP phosphatase NrnA [unclassified Paenibacillus]MBP1155961.1 phosphoesterase RecJ-like protein [Paenibacillus sp. PvP091]MBP1168653.1 phosphoesterase RecJ-like protein [Paenibacillus sp. PvR098]MBP2439681.1 phosphoesterase RecJ-like protein [Paenibacillus sp. PvP052]
MIDSGYEAQLRSAAEFIRSNDDFLVVSHVQPDGDASGSTFAMAWMLRSLNKSFTLINEGRIPEKFMYMAGSFSVIPYEMEPPEQKFGRIISVDCADFGRIGQVQGCFSSEWQLLNIDHHATNDNFGYVNLVRADAAATVEVLYDLVLELGVELTRELNICIYSGLLTDTGGFRYSNTSPKVLQIAADMLARGVQGHELAERLLETMTYGQVSLLKRTLSTLSFAHDNRVAWLHVTLDDLSNTDASSEDMDGLVNYARNVEGVEVGMLFKEKRPGTVKVSLRSSGQADVAAIAKGFGGGGHIKAAGCTINGSIEEAIEQVVKAVGKELS